MSWAPCNTTFCLFNVSADPCGECSGSCHLRKHSLSVLLLLALRLPCRLTSPTRQLSKCVSVLALHRAPQSCRGARYADCSYSVAPSVVKVFNQKRRAIVYIHSAFAGMDAVVEKMVTRLKDYQATAVPPVRPEGCNPVISERDAWRPCDSPEVCFAARLATD